MYAEARKIHLIEEMLKVDDDATLTQLEAVLKNTKRVKAKKRNIYDFMGVFNKKETAQIRKAIAETSETIHPDDWK
jgi:hypothetical protein